MSTASSPLVQHGSVLRAFEVRSFQPLGSRLLPFESQFLRFAMGLMAFLAGFYISFYISTWASFIIRRQSHGGVKVPPMAPYGIPFIGHTIGFALDPVKFLTRVR